MKSLILTIIILGAVFIAANKVQSDHNNKSVEAYRFSNTATWDESLHILAKREITSVQNWQESIKLPPPPDNSSVETKQELRNMVSYKELRTPDKLREIEAQIFERSIIIDGKPLTDYFNSEKYPETARLFIDPYGDITTIAIVLKEQYDRVRPHILEPDISPAIEVPGHPAYPSGHSTQAHFMAYLLSEVFPEKAGKLVQEADNIALNREIAGVHYKSDSEAGRLLARQFVDLLLKNPDIHSKIEKSRKELLGK